MVIESLKLLSDDKAAGVEAVKPDKYSNLKKTVQTWMNGWPNQESQTDLLRASGLFSVCPREFILNYWNPQPNREFDYKAQFMMSTGTHLHSYLQNQVLGPMGVLFGQWKHTGTSGIVKEGFHPDPFRDLERAVKGWPLEWHYVEPKVWDETHRISGHVDGVICTNRLNFVNRNAHLFKSDPEGTCKRLHDLEMGELTLLEIKTTGSYIYKALKTSSDIASYYKMQAVIYQKLMKIPRTLFWFIERDTMQSKTMLYKYEHGWWKDATRKARIIWEAIRDRTLPDSMMACKMPTDPRSKKCVHSEACWSRLAGAGGSFEKWIEERIEAQPGRTFLDLEGASFEEGFETTA
jgi:hypothetical protein